MAPDESTTPQVSEEFLRGYAAGAVNCRGICDKLDALETQRDELLILARQATNGWACYAKRKIEHAEIARLYAETERINRSIAKAAGR